MFFGKNIYSECCIGTISVVLYNLMVKITFQYIFRRNYLMTITKTQDGTKLTVAIEGELNTNTAPELEKEFETCLDGVTSLVIDAQKMDYISSAGLRALFGAAEVMQENGEMCVINSNDEVKNIFEVTGFVDIIDVK